MRASVRIGRSVCGEQAANPEPRNQNAPPALAIAKLVLHLGDFAVWPDPSRIDKATRRYGGAGDFLAWLERKPRSTEADSVHPGHYEDFVWLDAQHQAELLAGLTYLRNDVRWTFNIKWMENTHSG